MPVPPRAGHHRRPLAHSTGVRNQLAVTALATTPGGSGADRRPIYSRSIRIQRDSLDHDDGVLTRIGPGLLTVASREADGEDMVRAPRNVQLSAGPWPDLVQGPRVPLAGSPKLAQQDYEPTERDRQAISATTRLLAAHRAGNRGESERLRSIVEELVVQPPDTPVSISLQDKLRNELGWCAWTTLDGEVCRFVGQAAALHRHRADRLLHESISSRKARVRRHAPPIRATDREAHTPVAAHGRSTGPRSPQPPDSSQGGKRVEALSAEAHSPKATPEPPTPRSTSPAATVTPEHHAKPTVASYSVVEPGLVDSSGEASPVELHVTLENFALEAPTHEQSSDEYTIHHYGRVMRIQSTGRSRPDDVTINSTPLLNAPVMRIHVTNPAPHDDQFFMFVKHAQSLLRNGDQSRGTNYEIDPNPRLALEKKHGWYIYTTACLRCRREQTSPDPERPTERISIGERSIVYMCHRHAAEYRRESARRRKGIRP